MGKLDFMIITPSKKSNECSIFCLANARKGFIVEIGIEMRQTQEPIKIFVDF